ncbi:MAG: TaqI-like C-terminal specificity domain-containing protein [Blastocatellales bacterium]
MKLSERAAAQLTVRQLQNFRADQPWGVFLIEFNDAKLYRTALRQVLRGLVPNRRKDSSLKSWQHDNLLFICATKDYRQFTFAHFRGQNPQRATLAMFGWQQGDTHIRTLCQFNLPALRYPANPADGENWLKQWRAAFDVEAVTDKFFAEYREVFTAVESALEKQITQDEARRLFTQRLFNRLMFLYFIQKKGWLKFEGRADYLRALFDRAEAAGENFYRDRLYWVFFYGMSNVGEDFAVHTSQQLQERRGEVPYLNGGLFDIEDDFDARDAITIPDSCFAKILTLFERYNFTVMESTPLDVQVAVDPEMLGKVFEELVTGRHESGSYYTPRQIVSFLCREALKHYLGTQASPPAVKEAAKPPFSSVIADEETDVRNASRLLSEAGGDACVPRNAIEVFVDDADASQISDPEKVLAALQQVRVCDPACGSGAYLLGMLQELMRLRSALFKSARLDDASLYARKRSIIENNLYGVDKDKFAVQIAMLRLWLSLAIESDQPQPLPNLDFKIGCGDSLTAPAPNATETLLDVSRGKLVRLYRSLKGDFIKCNDAQTKRQLRDQIESLRNDIAVELKHQPKRPSPQKLLLARQQLDDLRKRGKQAEAAKQHAQAATLAKQHERLKRQLAEWEQTPPEDQERPFDWAVEFAEVFLPEVAETARYDGSFLFMNEVDRQPMFTDREVTDAGGGFDIVLANPPYVRMELFKPIKPILKRNFPDVHAERADLYVYFYDRAQQLLKPGGVGCFISSNKWLRAGYGENLRKKLLDSQAFHLIVDFGELPVFNAATFPAIFVWQRADRLHTPTTWAVVKELEACYNEGVREHVERIAELVPATQFGDGQSRLATSTVADRRTRMESSGPTLTEVVAGKICWGIKTGLNEAFIIDRQTRDELIADSPDCSEVIKPLLKGDDVRRYEVHYRDAFLLYMNHGVDARRYSAILKHLKPFKEKLEQSATQQEWYELQQPQAAYLSFLNSPKIIYPIIGKHCRFVFDANRYFINDKAFILPVADWYLLAVLNSSSAFDFLKNTCSVLGDEMKGGRLEFRAIYLEKLPIPDTSSTDRKIIANLAQQTQAIHTQRRKRVEKFLRSLGMSPAESSSRNPLEQPWTLKPEEFTKRAKHAPLQLFHDARDETASLTEEITRIEREIDERVAALYGVPLDPNQGPQITGWESEPRPFV